MPTLIEQLKDAGAHLCETDRCLADADACPQSPFISEQLVGLQHKLHALQRDIAQIRNYAERNK